MEFEKRKIFSNTIFDIDVLKIVIRKNWYWCILIFLLLFSVAFMYIRYTKPVYEAKSIIQINSENQSADILEITRFSQDLFDNALSKEIELLKSKLLFRRVISELPLDITYHIKGEFLTDTRYRNSSYETPMFICKGDSDNILLSFTFKGKDYEYQMSSTSGGVVTTPFFEMDVQVNNQSGLGSDCSQKKEYFQFNNITSLVRSYYSGLSIQTVDSRARTVEISYRNHNPSLAKAVVNSLSHQFFLYYEELKKEGAENIIKFIGVQLDSLKLELASSKDSVMDFRRRENVNNLTKYGESVLNEIDNLRFEEDKIDEEIRLLNTIKSKLNTDTKGLEIYRLLPVILGSSYRGSLEGQLRDFYALLEQKENLSYKVTQDNEAIRRLDERIELRKDIINDIIASLFEKSIEKQKIIVGKIGEAQAKYDEMPGKQMELERLQNIQNLNEKYYNLLTEKKVMYSISNAGYSSDNKILDIAVTPTTPVFPHKGIIYGASVFLSIVFSIGFLALRYVTFNNITQASDLKRIIPDVVGFLGTIPYRSTEGEESPMLVTKYSKSALSEAFRNLRINLSFIKKDVRTISMTSTISQEGKTFIVLNLAGVIAMTGKKVIIVDLDMRKPKIHTGFNVRNHRGTSNILAGHCSISEAINNSDVENLDFITAGAIPPNPSELLLSEEFDQLFKDLESKYDIVIYDCPPIGLVSDGVPIMDKVDVPLFTFRANHSKRYFIDDLKELIEIKKLNNIYVVLNGVASTSSGYGKKYGYGYGYGYYVDE